MKKENRYDQVPQELKDLDRWINWKLEDRDGKPNKTPYQSKPGNNPPQAKSTDPKTWSTYSDALRCVQYTSGLGFVLGDQLGGIDVDKIYDKDAVEKPIPDILKPLIGKAYMEISPSGTGIKAIFAYNGFDAPHKPKDQWGSRKGDIEIYLDNRYFAVTGDVVSVPEGSFWDYAEENTDVAEQVFRQIKPEWWEEKQPQKNERKKPTSLSANELIDHIRRSAQSSKFSDLYDRGDTSAYGKNASDADMGLSALLAFWCNCDSALMTEIFQGSALYENINRKRNPETYLKNTIAKAITMHGSNPCFGDDQQEQVKSKQNNSQQDVLSTELPVISITEVEDGKISKRLIKDISEDIKQLIEDRDPGDELFFVRNGEMGFLKSKKQKKKISKDYSYNETSLMFKPLKKNQVKAIINRVAQFQQQKKIKVDEDYIIIDEKLDGVSLSVSEDVEATLDYEKLPWINQFLSRPIIDKEYNLINEGGYDQDTGFYLDPERLVDIDNNMTLEEARDILENWLIDFDFISEADFANLITLGLTLMLRSALPYGCLPPLFLITSANPGSGKSTLANLVGIVLSGQVVGSTSISNNEEEVRKHLTAEAIAGTEFVIFDNAKTENTIDCGNLASAVTETKVRGRVLGQSKVAEEENNLTVCFTGNKITASPELVDRAIFIELKSDIRAAEREFKTNTIISDTIKNRDKIYSAFYTYFREWREAGANEKSQTNHRQAQWEAVIGGIMSYAAESLNCDYYNYYGANYITHKQKSDPEWMDMTTLVHAIADEHGTKKWTISEIMESASYRTTPGGEEVGDNILGKYIKAANHNMHRATLVGIFISNRTERVYGSGDNQYKIEESGKKDNKKAYQLIKIDQDDLV